MFKFGIYEKEQLRPEHLNGFFRSRKYIALDLYHSLDAFPQEDIDTIQERILSRFSIDNGCLKYTHARRFDDFDSLAFRAIATNSVAGRPIRVHDIGASDGRTCGGLYDHLNSLCGDRLTFVASDYYPYLFMLKRRNSKRRLIIDDQHRILQIVTPPFVLNVVRPESIKLYPLNHLIRHLATIFYARPLLDAYGARGGEVEKTRLDLVSHECRAYLAKENNFHFERYDLLSGPTEPFDIIRAMNLLKRDYFGEADLKRAVRNVNPSLNEGGLFVTGSNMERGTIVDGGIYKKVRGRLQLLEKSGQGSQVHALILADSESPGERTYGGLEGDFRPGRKAFHGAERAAQHVDD